MLVCLRCIKSDRNVKIMHILIDPDSFIKKTVMEKIIFVMYTQSFGIIIVTYLMKWQEWWESPDFPLKTHWERSDLVTNCSTCVTILIFWQNVSESHEKVWKVYITYACLCGKTTESHITVYIWYAC